MASDERGTFKMKMISRKTVFTIEGGWGPGTVVTFSQ